MKRILSLVLALSMVLSVFTFAFAGTTLTDIAGTDYEAAVSALVELGIVDGFPDGTYGPELSITRAQVAKLLVIASGKNDAAKAAAGAIKFNDPVEDSWASWATGYINVASQYGYVNGYPDGSFKPNNNVTYSEVVTMAVRVLGYTKVVENVGTWPTNYINKAVELKLLDGVTIDSYNDAATRGDIAIILWNMLRTYMWDITSDNETNGLTSSQTKTTLIDKYFDNFEYIDKDDEVTLVSVDIADEGTVEDGKVTVTLSNDVKGYTLKGGDLLRMIPGMKVVGLANTKTEELLTLTCSDTLVEGRVEAGNKVNGTKYTFVGTAPDVNDYIVGILDGKKITAYVVLPEEGAEEIKDKEALEDLADADDELEDIYLIDGAWATVEDLKVGDIYTEITDAVGSAVKGTYYVVSRNVVTGTYKEYVERSGKAFVKVDKTEYEVTDETTYYEYDEKDEEYDDVTADKEYAKKDSKYYDEDVKLLRDYLGNVVSVYFEEISKNTAGKIAFYITTGNIWTTAGKDGLTGNAVLTDMNNKEDEYIIDEDIIERMTDGRGVQMVFEFVKNLPVFSGEDGEDYVPEDAIFGLTILPAFTKTDAKGNKKLAYARRADGYLMTDEDDAKPEYTMEGIYSEDGIYDKDSKYILDGSGDEYKKVTSSTKVVTIKPVIEDGEVIRLDIKITNGGAELEGVRRAVVVCETTVDGSDIKVANKAAYVFVAESSSSNELSVGIADKADSRDDEGVDAIYTVNGKDKIGVDSKVYTVNKVEVENDVVNGSLVIWTTKEDKINVKYTLAPTDVNDDLIVTEVDKDAGFVTLSDETKFDEDIDDMEDTTFILVNTKVVTNKDKDGNPKELKFTSAKVLGEGLAKANFKKYDRIFKVRVANTDVVIIITTFGEKDVVTEGIVTKLEVAPTGTPTPPPTGTPTGTPPPVNP